MPQALARRPTLRPECREYAQAFLTLNSSRSSNGWAYNPIAIADTLAYARVLGLSREETLKLVRIVQAMDSEFMNHMAKKTETTNKVA